LRKWLQAFHLMCSSKKGVSSHQLHRTLDIAYQSAWFMSHRIRECMRAGGLSAAPMGGEGKIVEADETYCGPIAKAKIRTETTRGRPYTKGGKGGPANKRPIVALVERGGNVRTFHVPVADKATVTKIVRENIAKESRLHTDESRLMSARTNISKRTSRSSTASANMCAATFTRIRRKATSEFSSAACAASISTAKRSTCTATWRSSISATTTASAWVSTMGNAQPLPSRMQRASGLRIVSLTKRDFRPAALRFLRWRRKNWKTKRNP
jgi:ISXO2-like transposase domain